MSVALPLLIVGAGPFGLAMSRYARLHGIEHAVVGRPMSFWREQMPAGMLLRSGTSWHFDPADELTFEAWREARGMEPGELKPLSLSRYLDYASWFATEAGVEVDEAEVVALSPRHDGEEGFRVLLRDGREWSVRNAYLATGFASFVHEPPELAALIPPARRVHTAHLADIEAVRGERILIVGGRQSAFETAALACEAGAEKVWVSHRHPSPAIAPSDWSWVEAMVARMVDEPDWYRRLPEAERADIDRRFWEEGRLKVEPWLGPRLDPDRVELLPSTRVVACRQSDEGALAIRLEPRRELQVDRVVLATGFQVDLEKVSFLAPDLLEMTEQRDGFPVLDAGFQSSVPGLFVTSMPATRDFGAFLAFTVSVRAATRVAGRAIRARLER